MSAVVVRLPAPAADVTFAALGSSVRLIASGTGASAAVERARREILAYHARLSRFLPGSELSALNRDPRSVVPASPLLRSAVRAALWAAEWSGGLVDPCLLDALEAAGYARSHRPCGDVPLPSGPPRAASAHPDHRWRRVRVDDAAGTIERPPGLRLDLGGTGKGHVADLTAGRLAGRAERDRSTAHRRRGQPAVHRRWVVDCGGDLRVGGTREVEIEHPLRPGPAARVVVDLGAVATSSVVARAWTTADGRRAHHLLDPCTGDPVWTELLSATALAPTTLEAETRAKLALLRGGAAARDALAAHGGLLVHGGGEVEAIGAGFEVVT